MNAVSAVGPGEEADDLLTVFFGSQLKRVGKRRSAYFYVLHLCSVELWKLKSDQLSARSEPLVRPQA